MQTIAYYRIAKEDMDSTGYEIGLMGMEGRGLYAGANVGKDGASLYASWAENGGWNYGGGYRFEAWRYDGSEDKSSFSLLGFDLYKRNSLTLKADGFYTQNDIDLMMHAKYLKDEDPDVYTIYIHGSPSGVGDFGDMSAEEFVKRLKEGKYGYKGEKTIRLYSCSTGGKTKDGSINFAQSVATLMGVTVIAPTSILKSTIKELMGVKWTKTEVNNGYWKVFRP